MKNSPLLTLRQNRTNNSGCPSWWDNPTNWDTRYSRILHEYPAPKRPNTRRTAPDDRRSLYRISVKALPVSISPASMHFLPSSPSSENIEKNAFIVVQCTGRWEFIVAAKKVAITRDLTRLVLRIAEARDLNGQLSLHA